MPRKSSQKKSIVLYLVKVGFFSFYSAVCWFLFGADDSIRKQCQYKDEPPAVRVYTVCDESKYLIVRNVPSLGCGDELLKLFSTYGQVEECKPMDAEECEPYTDVYWIKFHLVSNARFAKRKLDESVFLGNRLQVSYAPEYESLSDTKEKLEGRRKEVLARLNPRRSKGPSESVSEPFSVSTPLLKHAFTPTPTVAQSQMNESQAAPGGHKSSMLSASSDKNLIGSTEEGSIIIVVTVSKSFTSSLTILHCLLEISFQNVID
ncbi:UNVERIFIED_CONTAM: RNA-binding protein 48 [Sesamum calycinum]|uniref:RNA-binding protein 48 n=1 Tax=Sesamum calycinum TaxID=2727403 RepID=A0AAW2QX98_9LAMI